MDKYVYVVSVVDKGMNVLFNNYVIKRLDSLDKVIAIIKRHYGIEFKQVIAGFHNDYWRFDTVYKNTEIALVVKRVTIID